MATNGGTRLANGQRWALVRGEALDVLRGFADGYFDSMVTDPPAGLFFMGKEWDDFRRARNPADVGRDTAFGRASRTGPEYGRGALATRESFIAQLSVIFAECYRVLKPGAYALVWAIPKTSHWTATALENVGFEKVDELAHIFGVGMPKSLDISKAIDKLRGAKREVVGQSPNWRESKRDREDEFGLLEVRGENAGLVTAPATDEAKRWSGFGTALKPAHEIWHLFRRPCEGTYAANVLKHGVGGLNLDGCRVEFQSDADKSAAVPQGRATAKSGALAGGSENENDRTEFAVNQSAAGRFPPNLVLSHSPGCVRVGERAVKGDARDTGDRLGGERPGGFGNVAADSGDGTPNGRVYGESSVPVYECVTAGCPIATLDRQSGTRTTGRTVTRRETTVGHRGAVYGAESRGADPVDWYGDSGGCSRFFPTFQPDAVDFFYQSKAPNREKWRVIRCSDHDACGLIGAPMLLTEAREAFGPKFERLPPCPKCGAKQTVEAHPTPKALALMRWLCRLVTPPGSSVVLDPFAGTGSTGHAALADGMRFVGIEREESYAKIAVERLTRAEVAKA